MSIDDRFRRQVEELRQQREDLRASDDLKGSGGGGTSGGVTEDWKASVDAQLGRLHADVRSLLRWGIASVVALAALIGGLYLRTDGKSEAIRDRQAALELKIEALDGRVNAKLDRLLARETGASGR